MLIYGIFTLDIASVKANWPSAGTLLGHAMSEVVNQFAIGMQRSSSFGVSQSQSGLHVKSSMAEADGPDVVIKPQGIDESRTEVFVI